MSSRGRRATYGPGDNGRGNRTVAAVAAVAVTVALAPPVARRLGARQRADGSLLVTADPALQESRLPVGGDAPYARARLDTSFMLPGVDRPAPPPSVDLSFMLPGVDPTTTVASTTTILPAVEAPTTRPAVETPTTRPSPAVARPGRYGIIGSGPASSGALALTFDDGFCDECVAGLVAGVERTGAHVTLCPNGVYGPAAWSRHAARIKVLIGSGQVAICNHTWSHKDLTTLSADQIRSELIRNERWIGATFGVSSLPYYRPPYGRHNDAVDRIAAELGYTAVLLRSGSIGDSFTHVRDEVLENIQSSTRSGGIILAHANHPVTVDVFDELVRITREAGLRTVTVPELLAAP